jgi:4-amino-4-deoxy-L-arabinose transferase-like glycosyltransferase
MSKPNNPALDFIRRNLHYILLIAIIALAAFFRFYELNKLPPGLHPDEAANGLDIFRMFKGDIRPLYNTNGPRESLFFFFQAAFVIVMGNTITALRMAGAMFGTLAVLTTYLWMRSWFGKRAGLIAAFLMAVTPWGVTISRDGFRASMTPLMVTLTLWLYTIAIRKRKTWLYLLAGASLGLGLYTYLAFRLFPFGLVLIAGFLYFFRRKFFNAYWKPVAISLIGTAIVLLPMGIYGVFHPGDVFARAAGTSVLNKGLNGGNPAKALFDSTTKTLLMFNVHGDDNYRQNYGGEPALNVFVGIMFILGVLISISRLNQTRYFALLAIWGTMLLPEALTAEGIPHFLRAIGALPFTVALATIGIGYMLDRWYATFPINSAARASGLGIIVVLLLLTAYQGYTQYFVAWANSKDTYQAYSEDAVAVGKYLISHSFDGQRYAVIDGYSDKSVQYLTYKKADYKRIDPGDINNITLDGKPKQFVVVKGSEDEAIKDFKLKFPGGRLSKQYSAFDGSELFMVYEVTK